MLEEIVCHFANAGDGEALRTIQKRELALVADLTEMNSGRFGAGCSTSTRRYSFAAGSWRSSREP
jgi:hypothetical protein